MIKFIQDLERKVIVFFKDHGKYILGGVLIGVLSYFMMMALNLVNDLDGIWHPSNFIAGDWEISLGRGLQRYADRARFGIVSDSFNSLLTLLLITTANAMILKKFEFENAFYRWLFVVLLVANPVVCSSLSYSYMSVNFGLAFFFSVAAFACIRKTTDGKRLLTGLLLGAVFIGISMAFYQAYICVTCVLVVMYMVKILLEKEAVKNVLRYLAVCAASVVLGGLIYLLITKFLLFRADIEMASYGGASNANVILMIKSLPNSLKNCYLQFGNYFYEAKLLSNLEFIDIVLFGLSIVYIAAAVVQFVKLLRQNVMSALLFAVMFLLLPVAGCFVLLIAVGNLMTALMSMGMNLCIVMLGMIVPKDGKTGFFMERISLLLLVALAWFQLSAVTNDQLALKEGKTATITLTENIVSQIYESDLLDEYQTVAFVGRPANNDRFAQSTAYHMANGYAKFGCWSTDARNNRSSWEGVVYNFLGVNLSFCNDENYREITALKQVADMPEFPSEGSICVIKDIIVVKVSELY